METEKNMLVQAFCDARIIREREYTETMKKYIPKQEALVRYMIEHGIEEIILNETEKLQLRKWRDGREEKMSIFWVGRNNRV